MLIRDIWMVPFLLVFHMRSERIDLNLNFGYHPGVPFFHHEISHYFVLNHCQNLCGRGGSLKRCCFPDLTPFINFTAVGCIDVKYQFFWKKIFCIQKVRLSLLVIWSHLVFSVWFPAKSNQTKPNTQLRQANATLDHTHATQIAASDSLSLVTLKSLANEQTGFFIENLVRILE